MANELTAAEHAVMSAVDNELLTLTENGFSGTPESMHGEALENAWNNASAYVDGTDVSVADFKVAFENVYHVKF